MTQGRQYEHLFRLDEKVALITGAGAGLGEAIAIGFAESGAHVIAADIDLPAASSTADQVRARGRHAMAIRIDVREPEQVAAMAEAALQEFDSIDILVNSAGIPQHDPAEQTPLDTWNRVIEVNLRGTFLCCQVVAPSMLRKGKGAIVNLSSIGGVVALGRGTNAFSASKGGVNALTKELALEWGRRGVRVNALAPCQFRTPALASVMADPQFESHTLMDTWTSNIPLGRIGEAHEIVGPAIFLASDAAAMVTGVVLPVDGGYLAR
jgi:NAD(P)-dependent dehydrogenase (short-subunit alcohol dehydrogenase family)